MKKDIPIDKCMKFKVLVPVKNSQNWILNTLNSIYLASANSAISEIRVLILDGGSLDKTLVKVNEWERTHKLTNFQITIHSKKDNGMYDAISRYLFDEWSDITSYLNSADIYEINVFEILEQVFNNKDINWVTAKNQIYDPIIDKKNELRAITYRRDLIKAGCYGLLPLFPVIQQESTFWRTYLTKNLDFEKLSKLKYAGDFFIWLNLARHNDLFSLTVPISNFVLHGNHLSHDHNYYKLEMLKIKDKLKIKSYFTIILDFISILLKLPFFKHKYYIINLQK